MKFTELTIHTTSEGSELVADVLWRYTNYGVAISDVKDVIALQQNKAMYWDYIDENLTLPSDVLVKAFIALDETEKTLPLIREDLEKLKENGGSFISFGSFEVRKGKWKAAPGWKSGASISALCT
ncbi:MAG: hypothetical protein K2O41_05125 [Clostridia bacterium]|nr:hypothetical protein [Clostridia bacterium]